MIMFGSMYYIVPRLVGREWRYASLIKLHFWASAYGIGLMTLMLFAGGMAQGAGHERSRARLYREHPVVSALSARPQSRRHPC